MKDYKKLISIIHGISIFREKRVLLVIFSIIISCIFYFTFHTPKNVEPILKVVEVVTAKPQNIAQTVRLIGTVRAKHATVLMSKATGVLEILKQSGEVVPKGTLIARINPSSGLTSMSIG